MNDDAFDRGVEQALNGFQSPGAMDRIADRALEHEGRNLILDQIIRGAHAHRFEIDFVLAVTGEQNDRRLAAGGDDFLEEIQTGSAAQSVIEKADVKRRIASRS